MNPLTQIRNTQLASKHEITLGLIDKASWHDRYKHSAYVFVGGRVLCSGLLLPRQRRHLGWGALPYELTEGDVLAVFSQYGEVVDVNLVRDKQTGRSKGFAFLAYEDQRSTVLAVDNLSGARVAGRVVRVEHVGNYRRKRAEMEGEPYESGEEEEEEEQRGIEARRWANDKYQEEEKKEEEQRRGGDAGGGAGVAGDEPWAGGNSVFALLTASRQREAGQPWRPPPPPGGGGAPGAAGGPPPLPDSKAARKAAKKEKNKEKKEKKEKRKKDKERQRRSGSSGSGSDSEREQTAPAPAAREGGAEPRREQQQQPRRQPSPRRVRSRSRSPGRREERGREGGRREEQRSGSPGRGCGGGGRQHTRGRSRSRSRSPARRDSRREDRRGGGSRYDGRRRSRSRRNNPEVLARRKQKVAELEAQVARMLQRAPGRVPDWDDARIAQARGRSQSGLAILAPFVDKYCLEQGKRCVMWDDEGTAGFFLMLNWDWLANRPAYPHSPEAAVQPGWWQTVRRMLRPPLMDPSVPDGELAAWIDANTMAVHAHLLANLGSLRCDEASGRLELDCEYGRELRALETPQAPAEEQAPVCGVAPPRGGWPLPQMPLPTGA
eukprot:scaffold7.g3588.t1